MAAGMKAASAPPRVALLPPRPPFRRPGKPERSAEAAEAQPAPAGLPQGLAAEASPAAVQAAGTTRPSEFAAAGSRRAERSAKHPLTMRRNFSVKNARIMVRASSARRAAGRI